MKTPVKIVILFTVRFKVSFHFRFYSWEVGKHEWTERDETFETLKPRPWTFLPESHQVDCHQWWWLLDNGDYDLMLPYNIVDYVI